MVLNDTASRAFGHRLGSVRETIRYSTGRITRTDFVFRTEHDVIPTARKRGPRPKPRNRITSRTNLPVNIKSQGTGELRNRTGSCPNQESLWRIEDPAWQYGKCQAIWHLESRLLVRVI